MSAALDVDAVEGIGGDHEEQGARRAVEERLKKTLFELTPAQNKTKKQMNVAAALFFHRSTSMGELSECTDIVPEQATSPQYSSSRRFPAFGDPSVPRVDAVLAKTGLIGVESTVLAPQERRLEAHKLAGGPKIVDSTMLRALMRLESTAESRLETVKLAPCRHALACARGDSGQMLPRRYAPVMRAA